MPQFMFKTRSGTGYLFRRGVPEDVRRSIGKREFKKQLGGDYKAACGERDRLAHETTVRIEAARQGLASLRENRFRVWDELEVIRDVTPELAQRFYSTVLAITEVADTQRRETVAAGQEPEMAMAEVREANRSRWTVCGRRYRPATVVPSDMSPIKRYTSMAIGLLMS